MSVQGSFLPDGNVLITIVCPPPGETEQIKSVAYVIDVSGSMGANATVKEGGSEQATGQSVLQLVSNLSLYLINFSLFLRISPTLPTGMQLRRCIYISSGTL